MKKIKFFVLSLICATLVSTSVSAASGLQGYVGYRDGVLNNLEYHTGIYITPGKSEMVHAPGSGDYVKTCSYDMFLYAQGDHVYRNYVKTGYRPGVSSQVYDNIMETAKHLASRKSIQYSAYNMLQCKGASGTIKPDQITNLRCDGVVEYCYELQGFDLQSAYGRDGSYHWNISNTNDAPYHTVPMSPKAQSRTLDTY